MIIIFSFISAYSWLQIFYNRNTRLRHSTWRERDKLNNHSKYIIESARKQPPVFYTKPVLKNFTIFTGKYLCWDLLLKNFQVTVFKRDSNKGVFLLITRNIYNHLFWRTSANGCFYQMLFRQDQSKAIWLLHNLFF